MNPLLTVQFHIPFDQIRAEHVEPAIDELIALSQSNIDRIAASAGPRTYESTLGALELATEQLDYAIGIVRHLEGVATYPELRAAYNAAQPKVSAFYSAIPLNTALYKVLKEFAATDEALTLSPTKTRLLKKTLDSFKRHGAELDEAGKKRLQEIDVELSKLTTKFSENVLDSTNAWELIITDESKLAGLPPTALAAARQDAERKGVEGWRLTLQAPSYIAVMTYLDDAAIREQIYRAYNVRASQGDHDNSANILRILELRAEKARLLDFPHFADLVLEDRMAHTGERAQSFLADLKAKTITRWKEENAELLAFAGVDELKPWDVGYYAEKQRKALYDFDEEELRPYFPVNKVVDGMFDIVQRLYGIEVREKSGVPVWHPEVKYYEIYDSGEMIGAFYADWFPRETKRGGAWMDAFLTGLPGVSAHLGLICGNMTPPIGDKPALLTHREVETIFHEFGHLLHHCLSRVEVKSLAGTSVAWDFVELPSQIMENWCWEREALDLFARHYETGEPIPQHLFERMKKARTFRAANGQMRQLGFAIMDLSLHINYNPTTDGDVISYSRNITQQFSAAPLPEDHAMVASFHHLFGSPVGYGAGYYSYKWAEVLDADAFTRFRDQGIFNREAGQAFRENILSKGDSDDPANLYRNFMHRDPDPSALLARNGLLVASS